VKFSQKRRDTFSKIEPWLYLSPFLIFIIIFTLYPVINVFTISFKENYSYLRGTFKAINFENYKYVLTDDKFTSGLRNTALYVLFVVPVSTAIALFFANLLNKKVRGSAIFQTAFFLPMVTSVTAVGLIWRLMYNQQYGIINWLLSKFGIEKIGWVTESRWSLLALIIFGTWNILPFTIIILLSGMQNINETYYTVARVDGAKPMRIFFRITVPLLSPTIFFVVIITAISSFQVFDLIFLMTQGGPFDSTNVLVYAIYKNAFEYFNVGEASAIAYVLFLIVLILTLIQWNLRKKLVYNEN
jgi:multiple sugar transport system permease protein